MRLSELLSVDHVRVPLTGTGALSVIGELCGLLLPELDDEVRERIVEEIREREREAPTGIGFGIAVPHARTDRCDEPRVAVGLGAEPLNFTAVDAEPVRLVFLVLCPADRPRRHLRLLARISRLMHDADLRSELMASRDAPSLLAALRAYEDHHFG